MDIVNRAKHLIANASPGPWYNDSHSHLEAGCRCGSCYVTSGCLVATNTSEVCSDTEQIEAAVYSAKQFGKQQDFCNAEVLSYYDAEFAAESRTIMPELVNVKERVMDLHKAYEYRDQFGNVYDRCSECGMTYPCNTIKALYGPF